MGAKPRHLVWAAALVALVLVAAPPRVAALRHDPAGDAGGGAPPGLAALDPIQAADPGPRAQPPAPGPLRGIADAAAAGGGGGGEPGSHKPLWPLDHWDALMLALTAVTLVLAAGGGIGGGAIYMPLFCALGGFNASQAVALSNVTIVGGAVANFLINIQRRHPTHPTAPLIDWALILIMEPTTILGAIIGTYANAVLPSVVTVSLMTVLLTLLTLQLARRAVSMHRAETRSFRARTGAGGTGGALAEPLLPPTPEEGGDMEAEERGEAPGRAAAHIPRSSSLLPPGARQVGDTPSARDQRAKSGGGGGGGAAAAISADSPSSELFVSALTQPPGEDADGGDDAGGGGAGAPLRRDAIAAGSADIDITISAASDDGDGAGAGGGPEASGGSLRALKAALAGRRGSRLEALDDGADARAAPALALPLPPPPGAAPQRERRVLLPLLPVLVLVVLSVLVAASDEMKAYVECGTWRYWLVVASVIPPALAATLLARRHLLRRADELSGAAGRAGSLIFSAPSSGAAERPPIGRAPRFQSFTGGVGGVNIKYTPRNTLTYPAVCTLAGVVAGMFGLGGGVIKAPLMLELGVLPEVATATSTTMILFTASSACIVYSSFGLIAYDYAAALVLLGLAGSAAGQIGVNKLVRAMGRRSIIVFTMASLMLMASGVAAAQAAGGWRDLVTKGLGSLHWGNVCGGQGDA